jgi:glutaredoxin 2
MIGAKVCPILEKPDGSFIGESLDIVNYLDQLDGKPIFTPSANRAALKEWIAQTSVLFRQLLYPRWVNAPLAEFETQSSRDYFTDKKQAAIGDFSQALANSEQYIKALEAHLKQLAELLNSEHSVNAQLSVDDIDLFGRLRGITLIKGLTIPAKVRAYIDYFSRVSHVPTYDDIAL